MPPAPYRRPARTLAIVVAAITVCEITVMLILKPFSPGYFVTALADAGLLILFLSPVLYAFLIRPQIVEMEAFRRVADGLYESEGRYRSVFQGANDAIIIITGPDGRIDMWNPKAGEMFGYSPDEAAGKDLYGLIVPERYRQKARDEMEKFFKTGEGAVINKTLEIFALRRDGSEFPIELSISRMKTATGWKAVGIIRDIAARREMEMNQRKLALAVEQNPISIVITDIDGNIQFVNKKFCQLSGYGMEEANGKNPRFLKSGEHSQEFYKELWNTILSGKEWHGEFHNKTKTGELYWEDATISPIKNEQGEITWFVGLKEDITQKKCLMAALFEDQELFNQLTDNSGIIFWIMSADGKKLIYINRAYEIVWGRSCESLYEHGESWLLAIHPDDREAVTQAWRDTVVTGKHYDVDYRIVRPDGEIRHIHAEGGPIRDDKGEIYRVAGVAEDITERMRLQIKLERTRERLLTLRKLAGIGQLTEGVCHEILNPLNTLSLQVQMLSKQRCDDPDLMRYMEKIKQQIQRIIEITDLLLMISGQKSIKSDEVVRIETVLDSALSLVENDFKLNNIRIVRDFGPHSLEIRANADEIKQAFLHVIDNARHAMPEGGALTISGGEIHENGDDLIRIKFSDTGIGIKTGNLEHIFNPFFSTRPEGEGKGMGLTICHTLITKNGGTMTVESEEGKGATFTIDLPPATHTF